MGEGKGQDEAPAHLLTRQDLARHGLSVRRYLAGILRPDELEDATQTVLQRALENLERYRGDSSPRVWLLGIARNVGLEVARARQRAVARTSSRTRREAGEEVAAHELLPSDHPSQEDSLGRKEQQALTLAALDGLSLDDKLALLVTYVDGVPGPEAAELLDLTFAAFRQRLSRARGALRKRLKVLMENGGPGNAEVLAQWQVLLDPKKRGEAPGTDIVD
ncbi:MAG: RNA polymerase sigma factor [Deltaproteobacteria bacterium]|nr:RNA polymerase sigma factor [Deltaproteobacteria bacterium]